MHGVARSHLHFILTLLFKLGVNIQNILISTLYQDDKSVINTKFILQTTTMTVKLQFEITVGLIVDFDQ